MKGAWYVYIVECSEGTLYTGITNNIDKRIRDHNAGIGSRYTKGRRPVKLLGKWDCADKSHAAKMEYKIKRLSRSDKLRAIMGMVKSKGEGELDQR
ncbi:MAG: GIY-YIG nuclease family protein [Dehalococcoidia bacterium]|jgi:putative endonuclease